MKALEVLGELKSREKETERASMMLRTHGRVLTKARLRCISQQRIHGHAFYARRHSLGSLFEDRYDVFPPADSAETRGELKRSSRSIDREKWYCTVCVNDSSSKVYKYACLSKQELHYREINFDHVTSRCLSKMVTRDRESIARSHRVNSITKIRASLSILASKRYIRRYFQRFCWGF